MVEGVVNPSMVEKLAENLRKTQRVSEKETFIISILILPLFNVFGEYKKHEVSLCPVPLNVS